MASDPEITIRRSPGRWELAAGRPAIPTASRLAIPTAGRRAAERVAWPALFAVLVCWILIASSAASQAPPASGEPSAWSVLAARDPRAATAASEDEQRILRLLTWEQLQAWLDGLDPARIELPDGRTLATLLGVGFDLSWWTIDGGGGAMSGGGFALNGTLGQLDTGGMAGTTLTLNGGFWPVDQLAIFSDGFETGDTSCWSVTVGGNP